MVNTVELLGYYGSDEVVALSAWSSTSRELTDEKRARIPKLLKMLREGSGGNSHETPWEKGVLHFLVTTDIASHIHILKSRIGVSVNSESARYKELKDDKYYIPTDWPLEWRIELIEHMDKSFSLYHRCLDSLVNEHGFNRKRAKESARFFNPYATQLTADVMFNFRSFNHFCKLRNKPDAQLEIREIAQKMIQLVSEIPDDPFHHSLRVWNLIED